MEWIGLTSLGITEGLVLAGVLPYLLLATGRLQPRKNVEDWRDAYFKSEGARAVEAETNIKVLGYLESADQILRGITSSTSVQHPEDRHVAKDS